MFFADIINFREFANLKVVYEQLNIFTESDKKARKDFIKETRFCCRVGKHFIVATVFYFGLTRVACRGKLCHATWSCLNIQGRWEMIPKQLAIVSCIWTTSESDFAKFSPLQNFLAIGLGKNTWNLVHQKILQSRTLAVFSCTICLQNPAQFIFFPEPCQRASIYSILTIGCIS